MSLREVQKQLTRKLLLESALTLFESKGYPATTVDDIASGAGTTRTTFYLHFPSKAELMKALIEDVDARLTEPDVPPLVDVVAGGDRGELRSWLARKADQWPDIMRCVMAAHAASHSDPEIGRAVERWFARVVDDIHAGLDKADRFGADSRHVRGVLAFAQLEFLSQRWCVDGWVVDRDVAIELLTDSWHHLLVERP